MLLSIKWLVVVVTVVLTSSEAYRLSTPDDDQNATAKKDPVYTSEEYILATSDDDKYATAEEHPDLNSELNLQFSHYFLKVRLPTENRNSSLCNTSICQQDAKEILESLDKSVDPCDDFYMFACGGWMEKHPATKATPELSHHSQIPENVMALVNLTLNEPISEDDIRPLKAAKKMFQVCMDVETIERAGIQPLVDISNEFGWPMAVDDWNAEDFSLETALAEYDRQLFSSPFFYTSVDTYMNMLRLYIHIQGPDIGLSRSELLDPWEEETREEYKHLIANVSQEILNASNVSKDAESLLLYTSEIVEFMIQLQNISLELTENFENLTLKELQDWTDSSLAVNAYAKFNWLTYLNKILSDTDIVLDEDEDVIVYDKDYLLKLFMLLDNTPRRVIANYLHWRIIDQLKGETTKRMQELTLHYKDETRSTYCLKKIQKSFNHVLNSKIFPNLLSRYFEKIFVFFLETILIEFETQIANVEWLEDYEREQLTDDLLSLKTYIGYPRRIYNNASALEDLYKQVNVSDKHFTNILIRTPNHYMYSLLRLREEFNFEDERWLKTRSEMPSAFFDYVQRAVYFTFGVLQPPFYSEDRLKSLNYGRIGYIVGHEIMHSIIASYVASYENNTNDNVYENLQKLHCFIDQYNNYHIPELEELTDTNVTVNGITTLIENLADANGAYIAYKAFQTEMKHHALELSLPGLEEYSPDQMFFIGYGTAECESLTRESTEAYLKDEHAPMHARVKGTVSNIEEFATAFNCPAGSNMNPVNKCQTW